MRRALEHRWRRLADPAFPRGREQVIVHAGHHKVGTVWFGGILQRLAARHGLRFVEHDLGATVTPRDDVVLYRHAKFFDRAHFAGRSFRGTHLIRDPRDVVVSGYFYHLWTDEPWANAARDGFEGRSYREELNRLDEPEGLLLEIEIAAVLQLADMLAWDYDQPEFLELRYEDLVADEAGQFERVLRHYGLTEGAVAAGMQAVADTSFRVVSGRELGEVGERSHLRSGRPGEWRDHFGPEHFAKWDEVCGNALEILGYEQARA